VKGKRFCVRNGERETEGTLACQAVFRSQELGGEIASPLAGGEVQREKGETTRRKKGRDIIGFGFKEEGPSLTGGKVYLVTERENPRRKCAAARDQTRSKTNDYSEEKSMTTRDSEIAGQYN